MGRRGPPPTPTKILAARDSWRAKQRKGEPPTSGEPEPPDFLDENQRAVWDQVCRQLEPMGLLGMADSNMLARYCVFFCRWMECERIIAKFGNGGVMPVRDDEGNVESFREIPQVARASNLSDQLLKIERQFGMSPSARASLAMNSNGQKEEDNPSDTRAAALRLVD